MNPARFPCSLSNDSLARPNSWISVSSVNWIPMAEEKRAASSFVKKGDRQMFTVELRPGETTIVSWKKLMKDSNKPNGSNLAPQQVAIAPVRLFFHLAVFFFFFCWCCFGQHCQFAATCEVFSAFAVSVLPRCFAFWCGVVFGSNFGFERGFCAKLELSPLETINPIWLKSLFLMGLFMSF